MKRDLKDVAPADGDSSADKTPGKKKIVIVMKIMGQGAM